MTTRDAGRRIEHFVKRAKSAFTQNPGSNRKMSTIEAFRQAAGGNPKAANTWREALDRVDENEIEKIIKRVPAQEMSDVAKDFTFRMLSLNRNTILHFS